MNQTTVPQNPPTTSKEISGKCGFVRRSTLGKRVKGMARYVIIDGNCQVRR